MPESASTSAINAGDTAWLLASAALVMFMTPALGFFYGGLVRRKNVLSTLMHSWFILALISVQWVLWGYSLAFSPDTGMGIIGGLGWVGLNGVGQDPNPDYAATVPHLAYMAFQMMFAVITPALITGAFAERKRFKAFVLFSLLWATFVYDPIAHWVWGTGGWLRTLGTLDFAGGTVVHITSGISALVAAIVLGKRRKAGQESFDPHDLTMVGLGAGGLCFFAVNLIKERVGIDDALDVFGVHGIGGTWGAIATAIFATVAVNSAGADGLIYGNPQQLLTQVIAVLVSWVYSGVMTFIILKAIDAVVGVRVPEDEEVLGLDTTQHGEVAYQL